MKKLLTLFILISSFSFAQDFQGKAFYMSKLSVDKSWMDNPRFASRKAYLNDMIKEGWNRVQGDPMCIKVLHQAGGSIAAGLNKSAGGFRNWMKTVVSDEVKDYLEVIENG